MTKKVMEVAAVTLVIQKTNPPTLSVNASGKVNSGGWSNGQLIPFDYKVPPQDGIYEFDFVADAPKGISTQVISDIDANSFSWNDYPNELKGVKVYSSSDFIIEKL